MNITGQFILAQCYISVLPVNVRKTLVKRDESSQYQSVILIYFSVIYQEPTGTN